MRVIAGTARGRRLEVADSRELRPTGDRQRETLFNVIATRIPDTRVLDLFAGTGALGIEALSRGASSAVFVERDRRTCEALQRNIEHCGFSGQTEVMAAEWRGATRRLQKRGARFGLLFADPPWRSQIAGEWLVAAAPLAAPGGLLCLERKKGDAVPAHESWEPLRTLDVGDTAFHLLQRIEPTSGDC